MRIGVLEVWTPPSSAPRSSSMATMTGFASQTFMPSKAGGCGMGPGGGIDMDVSAGIDAAGGVEPVALAGIKVVGAVSRRGMDGAGAGIGGDVGGEHAQDAALQERMLEGDAVERGALEAGEFFHVGPSLQAAATCSASAAATM